MMIEISEHSEWMLRNIMLHLVECEVEVNIDYDDAIRFLYEIADEKNKER